MHRYILMEYFLPLHHNLTFILYLHPYGCLLEVKLIFIGLPVRATTNEEMRSEFFYVKKRRNSGQNSQKALGIPLPFQWGQLRLVWYLNDFTDPIHANVNVNFAGRGPDQGCLVNRFGSWFGMNAKLLHGVIDPLSMLNDYVNTVFNVVVSLC